MSRLELERGIDVLLLETGDALLLEFEYIVQPAEALGFILEARNSSGDLLAILHNAFQIGLVEEVNRPPMLNFKLPSDDSKLAFVISANELWLRNYKTGALLYKFLLSKRKDIRV